MSSGERLISRIPGEGASVVPLKFDIPDEPGSVGEFLKSGALKGFPFGAVSAVAAAEVPDSVGFIQTAYHTSPVWGGGAIYRRCAVGEDILPGEITSADGARWALYMPMVSPQMFGASGVGDVANMAIDTHGCQMAADYYAATGIATQADNSTYIVDGYKGDRETWSAGIWAHGGIVITNGWKVYGNGATFKNGADNFRSVIRVRGGDTHFENITIDGDFPNRTEIPYDGSTNANFGVVRGCVLIYEGADSAEKRASVKNVALKNSGGYLFGIENIKAQNVSIENIYFENAGADCLDIKAYSTPDFPKAGNIAGVYCGDGCGHNFSAVGEEGGRNDQAVLDIGGIFNVSNVLIEGLDSDPASLGNTGVRFRSLVASENRVGAQGSTLTNAKVVSSKLANEGSETVKRIVGFAVNCSDVSIANVETRGCFYGALVGISGDPSNTDLYDVSISNAVFKDSTGENISDATAGVGLRVGAAARGFSGSNIHVKGGDHGLRLDGSGGAFSGLLIRDTDLAVRAASNIWRNYSISGLQLVNNAADTDGLSELSDSTAVTAKKHTIVADRQVFADFVSLANDSAWTGDNAWLGGQRYFTRDDSHVAGEVGRVGFLASGAAGSGFYYDMVIKGVTILRLREDKASFLKDVSIEGGRQLWTIYQSSANDSEWTGDNAWLGGQRYYTADTSTPGEVIRVGAQATGAAGSSFIYAIQHSGQTIADFRSDRMHANKPVALFSVPAASVATADAGRVMFFSDSADGLLKTKDSAGAVNTIVFQGYLGNAATLNVGAAAGTVAAGDDSRIVGAAQKSANLSDLDNAVTARSNLGLGTAATAIIGTSGATVPLLSTANTWGDAQTHRQSLTISNLASSSILNISSIDGQQAYATFRTANVEMWRFGKNQTANTGSNAGSNFALVRYDDAGVSLGTSISITRSNGDISLGGKTQPATDNAHALGSASNRWTGVYTVRVYYSATVFDASGAGSPEGSLTAAVGSTYRRTDGGAATTFYVKESGTGNTGWVAK